jgi:hypothetical protein
MFRSTYEQRLSAWRDFRLSLETADDPIQSTIDFYESAPLCKFQCDPYDRNTWPTPWEILEENNYCSFVKILAIAYTLQLTDRFSGEAFEIHIKYSSAESSIYYLLQVNDRIIGYDEYTHVHKNKVPKGLVSQQTYTLHPKQ